MQDTAEERIRSWSELLVHIARARALKKRAADAEDYAEASRLKKQEHALLAELSPVEEAALGSSSAKRARIEEIRGKEDGAALLTRRAWRDATVLAGRDADASMVSKELEAWAPPDALAPDNAESGLDQGIESNEFRAQASSSTASPAQPLLGSEGEAVDNQDSGDKNVVGPMRSSPVPGLDFQQFASSSNEELWEKAWECSWHDAEEAGFENDEGAVYEAARCIWKSWIQARDRHTTQEAQARAPAEQSPPSQADQSRKIQNLQEQAWSEADATEWRRVQTELERRKRVREEGHAASSRDLCTVVKQLCPADQPLPFERLLAVCPPKTTVRQLIQAISKEPQEFRQNMDGSEFCVRPVNSRCVDWLPVRSSTIPPGFREGACLSESVLKAAKKYFESKMRPAAQVSEDPLAHFLSQPGRVPHDTPLPFLDLLSKCPPGTGAADLVRSMSRRRDLFRQEETADGATWFCVRPRTHCKDWGAVNPYMTPSLERRASAVYMDCRKTPEKRNAARQLSASVVVGGPMRSAEDYGEE